MKYLFINVVAGSGSTGRIAAEQCRTLQAQGHECVLAYGRWENNCEGVTTHRIGTTLDYQLHGLMTRFFDLHGFGSKRATRKFLRWIKEYDPDVIWLHNIHGYYLNIELLFDYLKTCGKTIRWTLHDCWAFTGHCTHFTYMGCEQWKTECYKCVQLKEYPKCIGLSNVCRNFARKRRAFTGVPNLELITPSQWLADRVEQSFLKGYPVEVVYNKVDTTVFKPTPSDFRERYGLQNKVVILGVANVWNVRKGILVFETLASRLNEHYALVMVGLTDDQIKKLPARILRLKKTDNAKQLAEIYTAADLFVNPSVEETFGMTTAEALACGTRAIVYRGTACEEIVKEMGGIAVEQSENAMIESVLELTQSDMARFTDANSK